MAFQSVCVFCGSNTGAHPLYAQAAKELGSYLAHSGIQLVYGGTNTGLMGILANAALEAGGKVIGVIPQALQGTEASHSGLAQLEVVATLKQRKARMAELADAFIALPGGLGTLEELFEVWAWAKLGYQQKPLGLFEVNGFYSKLVGFLSQMGGDRLTRSTSSGLLQVRENADELLNALLHVQTANLAHYQPPQTLQA